MSKNNKLVKEDLLKLVRDAMTQDQALREQFQIGDKFRFIRDRLHTVFERMEENLSHIHKEEVAQEALVAEDEMVIFVHLFNAQGIVLKTWQKLLNPAVFYEFSVNRPIYTEKTFVETLIKNKPNKVQHAYVAIVVKKTDVITAADGAVDAFGHPIVKVREGSIRAEKFVAFHHNDHIYRLTAEGELEKKLES